MQTCLEKVFSVFCEVLREMEDLGCKEKEKLEDTAMVDETHEREVEA